MRWYDKEKAREENKVECAYNLATGKAAIHSISTSAFLGRPATANIDTASKQTNMNNKYKQNKTKQNKEKIT